MSIAAAAEFARSHQPETGGDKGDKSASPEAKSFFIVFWDDSDVDERSLNQTPWKTYNRKNHPNLAFMRLFPQGILRFSGRNVDDLAEIAAFAVLAEPSDSKPKQSSLIMDKRGIPYCRKSCQFLTLAVRGNVPEPACKPLQVVQGGYKGLLDLIESMWPSELKVVSTTRNEQRDGWQFVPRESRAGVSPDVAGVRPKKG